MAKQTSTKSAAGRKSAPESKAAVARKGKSKEMPEIPVKAPRLPKSGKLHVLSSKLRFKGKIFSVFTEEVKEPTGVHAIRDVVRNNGSVVILAVDEETNPADPLVVVERQYRHAAGQYLLEVPAGHIEPGEKPLPAGKRELLEETGYKAKKWRKLVRYYASPGFVGEWMEIYLATQLTSGTAQPEEDEKLEVRLMPLSELVDLATSGKIMDGKTLIGVLMYAKQRQNQQ